MARNQHTFTDEERDIVVEALRQYRPARHDSDKFDDLSRARVIASELADRINRSF